MAEPDQPSGPPRRRFARVMVGVVRAAGVLSVVVALTRGPVDAALLALVLAGLAIPRRLSVPPALDAGYGAALLVAAWSGVLGIYERIGWWDLVVHCVATGTVAAVAYLALLRLDAVLDPRAAGTPRRRAGVGLVTACVGLGLSVLWELAEWSGHTFLDTGIYVGYQDTLGDLVAGGLGSLAAGLLLAVVMSSSPSAAPAHPASGPPGPPGPSGPTDPPSAATAGSDAS